MTHSPSGPRSITHPACLDSGERRAICSVIERTLAACDAGRLTTRALQGPEAQAFVELRGALYAIAVGKAGVPMARALLDIAPVEDGLVVSKGPAGIDVPPLLHVCGAHPVPDERSVAAARGVIELAARVQADHRVVLLLSGGASALLCAPAPGVGVNDIAVTTDLLLRSGADIQAMNCVRSHLDILKGGGLAERVRPAPMLTLVLADVVGADDPVSVVGSGPSAGDASRYRDAHRVLEERGLLPDVPTAVAAHLQAGIRGERPETPAPGGQALEHVRNLLVADNGTAAAAAAAAARTHGFDVELVNAPLTGEARLRGREIGERLRASTRPRPHCLIFGGETTVTVRGTGLGGRNQELALAAALELDGARGCALVSLATDGEDGPSGAAGAAVDGETLRRAAHRGLDPAAALTNNDSHGLFAALDELLLTGPTGTNLCDLTLAFSGLGEASED